MRLKTERAATLNPSSRPNRVGGSGDPSGSTNGLATRAQSPQARRPPTTSPSSFNTLTRVVAGNSVANVTSATPGGAGVNQAFNVASLKGIRCPTNAMTYSVAQQLVTTAWNIIFAIVLMACAFGWSGGKKPVTESYSEAKEKEAERKATHEAKRQAKREAKLAGEAAPVAADPDATPR